MKKLLFISLLACGYINAQTVTYEITVTNITKNQIFSPPVAISHDRTYHLFYLGEQASEAVYTMAEDGNAGLIQEAGLADERVTDVVIADGPLMPGASVTLQVEVNSYSDFLTVAGMLVTTNDAFFAVDGMKLPGIFFKNGIASSQVLAQAYDAGSEANTEDCGDIPGPPCGNPGNRVTDGAEGYVHVHSGVHGVADVDAATYDWRGSVARISVAVAR